MLLACCMCCSFGLLCLCVCLSLSLSVSLCLSLSVSLSLSLSLSVSLSLCVSLSLSLSSLSLSLLLLPSPPFSPPSSPPPPPPSSSLLLPGEEGGGRREEGGGEEGGGRREEGGGRRASSRMGTAPQRERSDTPDARTEFAGELKDSHGTTARALRHARSPQRVHRRAQGFARHHTEGSPASDPTRPIPAECSPASSRIRTAPQRERSDTPDPRRGFIGELKDSHGTTQRVRRRAIRHARSPQRVRRRAQGFARHHSESAPTRPIPAEGSSASSRIRTAPQRERSDTPDPCRGFIGELKDSHGTTARALRHARSR